MAAMVMTAMMKPNGEDENKNQVATAARVITTVTRAMVIGAKRAMATKATMATTATTATTAMTMAMEKMARMMQNSKDAASGVKGNDDTKQ